MFDIQTELIRAIEIREGDTILKDNLQYRVNFCALLRGTEMELVLVPADEWATTRGRAQTIHQNKFGLIERVIKVEKEGTLF